MAAPRQQKHHVRQEICGSRARYREGRIPKAVKVYTVNQESKYVLVQGVPAVGAQQELVKLFALYGTIEEYRLLDEYPCEEFTEVFWIKFEKIQSARVTKKKLDDHSFFGGVLHVCYAPEFESVHETREKLQDRRRAIASRLRKLGGTFTRSTSSATVSKAAETTTKMLEDTAGRVPQTDHTVTAQLAAGTQLSQLSTDDVLPCEEVTSGGEPKLPPYPPLPPPPQHMHRPRQTHPQRFEHTKVPSAEGTVPMDFNPQFPPPAIYNTLLTDTEHREDKPGRSQTRKDDGQKHLTTLPSSAQTPTHMKTFPVRLTHIKDHHNLKKSDAIIIRSYKKAANQPRFVPRQVTKRADQVAGKGGSNSATGLNATARQGHDPINAQLKANALTLSDVQGPQLTEDLEEARKRQRSDTGDESLDHTTRMIRKKVKEFSTAASQIKKKRTS